LLAAVQGRAEVKRDGIWEVCIDSTVVRAHQHAAGARRGAGREDTAAGVLHPLDEALGRSRGGLTSKIHLACDGHGRPLAVILTPGQRHDSTQLEPLLDAIRVPRSGRGRPRTRPGRLLADKGYSNPHCRAARRRRGIPHTIPERRDQRAQRAQRPGRRPCFECGIYVGRNVVERCINRLKQFRGLATRYEKRAINYRAMVVLAALVIWLRT
jgi:transposase